MDISSFEIVGHYSIWTGEIGKFEVNDILRDKEFNYWYKINSETIEYPWEVRILDATQVWTNGDINVIDLLTITHRLSLIQTRWRDVCCVFKRKSLLYFFFQGFNGEVDWTRTSTLFQATTNLANWCLTN